MDESDIQLAQILWDYHRIEENLIKSDVILGLGSYDLRVAERCAELLQEAWAPLIVFSGAQGNFTEGKWPKSEAEMFADVAIAAGADVKQVLVEPHATNTGENVRLTKALCDKREINVRSLILVAKPNMTRRGLSTMQQFWREVEVCFSYPDSHFLDPPEGHLVEDIVSEIVGDFQRIVEYPRLGYQSAQPLPDSVVSAYEQLIDRGYTNHHLKQP